MGEVGYAPMQHTTHSHPNSIPILPTHSSCLPPHIISCCPLEPARCIVSRRYLGNYLISLDDDGPSFDKAINSTCNLQCRQDVAWSILCYFNTVHACALFVNWSRIPQGVSPPQCQTPRTQQPNTTDTIVNLSNKRLTTAEKRSSIRDCPLYRTQRRPNQEKSYTTSLNSKQIYTELCTEIQQPPTKTSQTHQQQYHRRHIHQVKVKDIKEEVDKTLKMPPQPLSRTSTPRIYFLKNTHKTQCLTDPLSAQPHITTTTKQSKDW